MKSHAPCYGQLFSTAGRIAADCEVRGKVFEHRVEHPGVIPVGFAVTANIDAWDECTACPEFATCYPLSAGKLLMELAARG
jgi:hypothetical protein